MAALFYRAFQITILPLRTFRSDGKGGVDSAYLALSIIYLLQ